MRDQHTNRVSSTCGQHICIHNYMQHQYNFMVMIYLFAVYIIMVLVTQTESNYIAIVHNEMEITRNEAIMA
jgi:hypothetical protein